ncbi:MAG: hypothetical protein ACK5P6_09890 [Pseudobdellovibrionaceae bacterium]
MPLDANNFVFPGASAEQQVVISQILGLMINETICEMECSLPRLKLKAWENILNQYPVNKEMRILGEMVFDEEEKHAQSFQMFFGKFCHQLSIEPKALKSLLPSGFNSQFQKNLIRNAELGGAAFWWTAAAWKRLRSKFFEPCKSIKDNQRFSNI